MNGNFFLPSSQILPILFQLDFGKSVQELGGSMSTLPTVTQANFPRPGEAERHEGLLSAGGWR